MASHILDAPESIDTIKGKFIKKCKKKMRGDVMIGKKTNRPKVDPLNELEDLTP